MRIIGYILIALGTVIAMVSFGSGSQEISTTSKVVNLRLAMLSVSVAFIGIGTVLLKWK